MWLKDRTASKVVAETLWIKIMNYSRKNRTLHTSSSFKFLFKNQVIMNQNQANNTSKKSTNLDLLAA